MGDNQFLAEIKYWVRTGPEWVEDYQVKYFYFRYSSPYYLGSVAHYNDFINSLALCWKTTQRNVIRELTVSPPWSKFSKGATIHIFRYNSCYSVDNDKLGGLLHD